MVEKQAVRVSATHSRWCAKVQRRHPSPIRAATEAEGSNIAGRVPRRCSRSAPARRARGAKAIIELIFVRRNLLGSAQPLSHPARATGLVVCRERAVMS